MGESTGNVTTKTGQAESITEYKLIPTRNDTNENNVDDNQTSVQLYSTTNHVDTSQSTTKTGCFSNIKLFVLNICFLQLLYMFVMVYSVGVVRTVERRFGLRSRQTGVMAAMNDVSHILIVTFVGYFSRSAHKPRIICYTLSIFVIACFLQASNHWTFPAKHLSSKPSHIDSTLEIVPIINTTAQPGYNLHHQESRNYEESLNSPSQLCFSVKNNVSVGEVCSEEDSEANFNAAYGVFLLANFIAGIGGCALTTMGISYIDENCPAEKSSIYVGILTSMFAFGPMGGFILAAFCLKLPEDLFGNESDLLPTDPGFIGAWWLGYVLCGAAIALALIPMWFFPQHMLPPSEKKRNNPPGGTGTSGGSHQTFIEKLKDFPKSLMMLLRNKAYLVYVFCEICGVFIICGFFSQIPRYVEVHFRQPAFVGAIIAALLSALAGAVGALLGGLLMSRLRLQPTGGARVIAFSTSVMCVGLAIAMALGCPQLQVAGSLSAETGTINTTVPCNTQCACPTDKQAYAPVCGADGTTYYSACHAGCTAYSNGTFNDCSCVTPPASAPPSDSTDDSWFGVVSPGACKTLCPLMIPYAVSLFVVSLLGSLGRVPGTMLQLRLVGNDQRAFGLSFTSFAVNLFGFIPGPILFGQIIDSTCLLWRETCDGTGNCLLYNTASYRLLTHGVSLIFNSLNLFGILIIIYLIRGVDFSTVEQNAQLHLSDDNKCETDDAVKSDTEMVLLRRDSGVETG